MGAADVGPITVAADTSGTTPGHISSAVPPQSLTLA